MSFHTTRKLYLDIDQSIQVHYDIYAYTYIGQ